MAAGAVPPAVVLGVVVVVEARLASGPEAAAVVVLTAGTVAEVLAAAEPPNPPNQFLSNRRCGHRKCCPDPQGYVDPDPTKHSSCGSRPFNTGICNFYYAAHRIKGTLTRDGSTF